MDRALTSLKPAESLLLVVDLQEKLLPAIHNGASVLEAAGRIIRSSAVFEVPLVVTEQYPKGLGSTCAVLQETLQAASRFEKTRFSGCTADVVAQLRQAGRPNIVVVGVEAHVCVQQTVLDLLRLGYLPFVCADAVGSRRPLDAETALARMRQAGTVVTTTESVVFEWTGEAGTDAFKRILKIVK